MRRLTAVVAAIAVLALLAAGCGSKTKEVTVTGPNGQVTTQTVPDVHFAKTKFILHAGLAFGAFHRYIVKPFRAGKFRKGASGRTKALVKAAAAGLFAVHELKQARRAALSDDRLRPLAQKIDGLGSKLAGLAAALKHGSFNPGQLLGADGAASALGSAGQGLGATIKDRAVPGLGG